MPLPTFTTVDEVPEAFREFAREVDGKFTLDLVPGADVHGLKRKNAELLGSLNELKSKFDGIDPDEYKVMKETGGKVTDLDNRLKISAENEQKANDKAAALAGRLRNQAKQTEITTALAEKGGEIALLGPVVAGMVDVIEEGDAMHVVVRNADGSVRVKDGAGTRFAVTDLLDVMMKDDRYKRAFNVAVGSGGGATVGGNNGAAKVVNVTDQRAYADNLEDIAKGRVRLAG